MILDVWKPRFKKIDNVKVVSHLEWVDKGVFSSEKKSGWTVRYLCDTCNSLNTTTSHVLFNKKTVLNTLEKQTCRSCRTRISEYEIKKTQIPYDVLKNSVTKEKYILLLKEQEYNLLNNKSQKPIPVICDKGHRYNTTWNNWSKNKRCRVCYEKNKYENSVKYKDGWDLYKFLVWFNTENNYKTFLDKVNPKKIKRGREYHLDHKFSISEGFKLGILPIVIADFNNLEIIKSNENMSKGSKCSITIEELYTKHEYNS
jgi:hypothetical protein